MEYEWSLEESMLFVEKRADEDNDVDEPFESVTRTLAVDAKRGLVSVFGEIDSRREFADSLVFSNVFPLYRSFK